MFESTMELTIEQALQQAIEAHKAGKLQDAEGLYRAILVAQPKHPDANHNLGVLAFSLDKTELALPLFKTALEANPSQGQFWLSYVDALIKEKQFENASNVLEQGKKRGLTGEKVDVLEAQLTTILLTPNSESSSKNITLTFNRQRKKISTKKEKKKHSPRSLINLNQTRIPSQFELNTLLEYYQKGQYDLAQNLATTLTQQYPNHPFGWKVMGALFKKTGKLEDSVVANQKVLEISPNDAEAHSNLGITLKELGRLEDAEISCKQAIAIKPDYAEAYYNLGVILQELGRLEDAEISYNKAIAIKPDLAEAHSNLGNTLKELGRFEDAEISYKKAIAIKPDYAEAHYNLGVTLQELGRLEDAETSHKQAIAIKPDLAEAHSNLGYTLKELGRLEDAEISCKHAIAIKPDYAEAHSNLGFILKWLGRIAEAQTSFAEAVRLNPDFIKARNEMLACLYLMDKKLLFFNELDYSIKQDIANSVTGSLICRSALKYGEEKPNIFCNTPLEHVLHVDLKSRYDFEDIFVRNAKAILSEEKRSHKKQTLLLNGYQTSGNLFNTVNTFTNQIQKSIRLELERYRINFEGSQEGFIRKWPTEYSLFGWLISMKSGGELLPHIHENGWISGSVYINVPPKLKVDSGNLVVALGKDSDATNLRINSKKVFDVVTGSMVLFPASLMHHTIPFESEEERIVLAFDVIPK
jgi:tetratricopeptide (TPR) repeat protein